MELGNKRLVPTVFSCPPPPGLPLAPGEVEVVGERVHQLRVTWTPPFSLPGELISYSLLVTDKTTGFTSSLGPLNDTNFTHQISERQALDCHLYSFSVFSLNDVGLSPNSSSSTALHPSGEDEYSYIQSFCYKSYSITLLYIV